MASLYKQDFVAWTREQASALRAAARGGSNQNLDWENLAEEIESLGISQRRELKSQIRRIVEHLLKLESSRALDPRNGWIESVDDARAEIQSVIEDSPSLKNEIGAAILAEMERGSRKAIKELEKHGDLEAAHRARLRDAAYREEEVLGDWFPEEPNSAAEGK